MIIYIHIWEVSNSALSVEEKGNGVGKVEGKVSSVWRPTVNFIIMQINSQYVEET